MSFVLAEVPSLINYQARLTESNGAPVTGTKTVSLEIYDSAVNGNVLYTELIGPVVIAANGIYNFQFGASGTSNTLITEPLASTDGVAAAFQKILSNGPITANSLTVSDGVYSWSQVDGSSDDTAFGVAYSAALRRVTVNYYNGAPAAGKAITATYRYGTTGITGALSSGTEHWMALSVDGVTQEIRQRVLTVPFALNTQTSQISKSLVSTLFSDMPFNFFANAEGTADTPGKPANQPYTTITGHSVVLPLTISGNGYGEGWAARQLVPVGAKVINRIEVGIEANATPGNVNGVGGGLGGVRLISIDRDGIRSVINESKVERKDGLVVISQSHVLNKKDFQYFIEVWAGTFWNNGFSGGVAKAKFCKISYEGLPID
jgi:hypothetical protein